MYISSKLIHLLLKNQNPIFLFSRPLQKKDIQFFHRNGTSSLEGLFFFPALYLVTAHRSLAPFHSLYAHIGKMLWLCDILVLDFSSWAQAAGGEDKMLENFLQGLLFPQCIYSIAYRL